jgi:hypothetical protein
MVRIKTWRLTRNPQLGDPVAWLNLTLADGRELDDVALHRSPGGRWFFQGWGWLSADRRPTAGTQHCRREPLFMPHFHRCRALARASRQLCRTRSGSGPLYSPH